jgi:hypothetical protein
MGQAAQKLTEVLEAANAGQAQAAEALLPLVYDELRHLAAARMAQQPPGHGAGP